jgi:ketosteroid isomerase-like protein
MSVSEGEVRALFAHLEHGDGAAFFAHVADDVDWTVQGTHPLAGRYRSKADFVAHTFARLNRILPGGTQLVVEHVLAEATGPLSSCARWRRRAAGCVSTTATAGSCASRTAPSCRCALTLTRHRCRS